MKSVIVCLLLLMTTPSGVGGTQTADDPPIFSLKEVKLVKMDSQDAVKPFVDRDASRVVIYHLDEKEEYLMRVDPPEHCTRFVICNVDRLAAQDVSCATKDDSILVYPHGQHGPEIHTKTNIGGYKKEFPTSTGPNVLLDEYIKISIKMDTADPPNAIGLVFQFKKLTLATAAGEVDEVELLTAVTLPITTTHIGMRVETSSFYCNVHVGTTTKTTSDVEPKMYAHEKKKKYLDSVEVDPFQFGKPTTTIVKRKCFGPLFKTKDATDQKCPDEAEVAKAISLAKYNADAAKQCPFAHDWMGFSRWSGPPDGDLCGTLLKNPIYKYTLTPTPTVNDAGSHGEFCGKKHKHLYMIDIEIDNVFNPTLDDKHCHRCLGFALAFGANTDPNKIELKPENTFEFYPVAMMFLAPNSDKIRELRSSREALKKIRISFYDDVSATPKKDGEQTYAIVEYGFINDRIAGVREYVLLPDGVVSTYKSVTLVQEGFCNVRVLNVNHNSFDIPDKRCWNIGGCSVQTVPPEK